MRPRNALGTSRDLPKAIRRSPSPKLKCLGHKASGSAISWPAIESEEMWLKSTVNSMELLIFEVAVSIAELSAALAVLSQKARSS